MSTRSEIETRLTAWASAQSPPVPVAYENVDFDKPNTGGYVELFMLDNATRNRNLSAQQRTTGMFQINVYMPLNEGMGDLEDRVDAIAALYPVVPKFGTVSIEQPLSGSAGFVSENFMCIPMTGRYRVEV